MPISSAPPDAGVVTLDNVASDVQRSERLLSLFSAKEAVIADISQSLSTVIVSYVGSIKDPVAPVNRRKTQGIFDAYVEDLEL